MHDGYTFIHNGAVYPKDALDDYIADPLRQYILGDTDSEQYFYFLLTEIYKLGLVDGIRSALAILKKIDFSSINAMILTDSQFITICEHDPDRKPSWAEDGYYDLYYKITEKDVVVASSGWNQDGWKYLPNHQILVVDRATLATDVLAI
jgi:predicted glutamine amidotransferase